MTPLVAVLAASFLPARAAAVLARHADPAAAPEAARLAGLPRAERLAELEAALAAVRPPSRAAREALAALERPRLGAQVRAGNEAFALHPLLRRLVLERGWE